MKQHNYLKKIEEMKAAGTLPQIAFATVAHDNHCQIFKGGVCNCNPSITVRDAVQAAQYLNRQQRRDQKRQEHNR